MILTIYFVQFYIPFKNTVQQFILYIFAGMFDIVYFAGMLSSLEPHYESIYLVLINGGRSMPYFYITQVTVALIILL